MKANVCLFVQTDFTEIFTVINVRLAIVDVALVQVPGLLSV
jgi:hypothetical protein